MGHVGDGEGRPSSAAGASDKSLPITPAAPAPAPAARGGPVVAAVDIAAVMMTMIAGLRPSPIRPVNQQSQKHNRLK